MSAEFTKKYSGATMAAVRTSADRPVGSGPSRSAIGRPATQQVIVSEAMLNTIRCSGLRPSPERSVHCAHAPTAAMHAVSAGPMANSAQKLIAWDSDRFEWLRPSGSSIFTDDVITASPSSVTNNAALSSRSASAASTRQTPPVRTDGGDVGARARGQRGEGGRLLAVLHHARPSCSQRIWRSAGR